MLYIYLYNAFSAYLVHLVTPQTKKQNDSLKLTNAVHFANIYTLITI